MTRYNVMREYQLSDEADWENPLMAGAVLYPGDVIEDGEIEPDIVANLVSRGIFERDEDPAIEAARLADPSEDEGVG